MDSDFVLRDFKMENGQLGDDILTIRVRQLEEELRKVKMLVNAPKLRLSVRRRGRFAYAIANHVDSVVGLKEALTWEHGPLRIVWLCLLLLGGAATAFYVYKGTAEYLSKEPATKVSHNREVSYEYPPFVFCPPWWINVDIAHSMGLQVEALKYSLGWLKYTGNDYFSREPPPDLAGARESFLKFYSTSNFTSLLEYFKALSPNTSSNESATMYSHCTDCKHSSPVQKKLFTDVVCYVYHFNNATGNSTISSSSITLSNRFRAPGVLKAYRKSWLMDILPNVGIDGPSASMKPFFAYAARISVQRFIMLNSSNRTCVDSSEYPEYSQRACVDRCLRDQRPTDELKAILSRSFVSEMTQPGNPEDVVNTYDLIAVLKEPGEMVLDLNETHILNGTFTNFTAAERLLSTIPNNTQLYCAINETINTVMMNETIKNDTIKNVTLNDVPSGKEEVDCYDQCKPTCDRFIYDMTLERHRDDDDHNDTAQWDVSTITVFLKHAAVSQGGIITWQEVDTVTFSDFVSNVGGTLGLFLGCTLMTLAQVALSVVNLAINGRRRKIRTYNLPVYATKI